jgi:hypothetical protein
MTMLGFLFSHGVGSHASPSLKQSIIVWGLFGVCNHKVSRWGCGVLGELSTMPCACLHGVSQGVNALESQRGCFWLVP